MVAVEVEEVESQEEVEAGQGLAAGVDRRFRYQDQLEGQRNQRQHMEEEVVDKPQSRLANSSLVGLLVVVQEQTYMGQGRCPIILKVELSVLMACPIGRTGVDTQDTPA